MGDPTLISTTPPPAWSLWVGDLGRVSILAATALFAISVLGWLFAADNPRWRRVADWSFGLGALGVFTAFISLGALFVGNRFEFEYVWGHSDIANAIPYRIAGIWSGQEGSFLLWVTGASIFGLLARRGVGDYKRWFTIFYATFLGSICGILAYETPFAHSVFEGHIVVPQNGVGLSPSLQNYWVTIHPPTIFMGFASLTVLFALAMAAMAKRDYETWIPIVRPWAILSATLVGVGLCMGGFWAYETLGWGGFWMWDPVENVSFVPWCLVLAFVHGIIVQTTRKRWHISNLLLGALPFLAFVYGTFLTRSGFLANASVHSFAEMNGSALWVLVGVLFLATFGFLGLWLVRLKQARGDTQAPQATGFHREGFYRYGAILLSAMGLAALIGMSVPLFMALAGKDPKVVEEPLYHMVVPWIFVPLMLVMAAAPFATWRGLGGKEFFRRIYNVLCITVGLAGLLLVGLRLSPLAKIADLAPIINFPMGIKANGLAWLVLLGCICLFVVVANAWRMVEMARGAKLGLGSFVSHIGIAVLMTGLILSRGFERHGETVVMKDHPGRTLNYAISYKGMTSDLYDRNNKLEFEVHDPHDGKLLFVASPGLYYVRTPGGEENPMVWPFIKRAAGHDVYFTLRPPQTEGSAPIEFQPGETKQIGGLMITYEKMTREGEPGVPGTKFGAQLKVVSDQETFAANPTMEIVESGGVQPHPASIDPLFSLAMIGMNAGKQSVTLQMQLTSPMYPIEIYHKPFTSFVWGGTAIMMVGGFMSALYRRPRRKTPEAAEEREETETVEEREPVGVA
ncbi:MAG: cytochrome c biogenesis protein CcsA [Fimbriimonadaceae bacterium]|nr:cytochrome c biogenesis protein CcsA [Chthonomonadaceae bacterium]MCO5295759.1 cytochrome c biogenesis protein CcsA [Fimbriimonadaceae bacterium]